MRRQRLEQSNFSRGMLRDSATDAERLLSLRTLTNYFVDYSDGRLKVRNGYSRWNAVALEATATQLFWFADLDQNEHLLGILDDDDHNGQWYKIAETGAHSLIDTQIATARRPALQVKDRFVFGTNSGGATSALMWADNTSIGAGTSYRVGIDKPSVPPSLRVIPSEGNTDAGAGTFQINTTSQRKVGIKYTPTITTGVRTVSISCRSFIDASLVGQNASLRVSIQTDSSGEPSGTLVSDSALGNWKSIHSINPSTYTDFRYDLRGTVELVAGTDYWLVVEGDDSYYDYWDNFTLFVAEFEREVGAPYDFGESLIYNNTTDLWNDSGGEAVFFVGGLTSDADIIYSYYTTFVNETYGIESRPSEYARIQATSANSIVLITVASTTDGQVDKVRIYRRPLDAGLTIDADEDDITTDIQFVADMDYNSSYYDAIPDDYLGAILQTQDHYRFDETDDGEDEIRPSALVPNVVTYWKSRIWFAEANDSILYFSKVLEKDGRTGLTGDSIPDFYPLDNRLEISETSDIIALVPLSADELAVYFRNKSIWVIRGSDDVLNPPADIVLRQSVTDVGLVAPAAVDSLRSRHVFVARKGVYTFAGTSAIEYLSGGIQTILDEIADSSLDDSVVVALGDSVWIAVDEDETGDGKLNNIYILDIQRQPATWRLYNYDISIYDMVVRKTGTEYKTLLAADADSAYILQLEDGNTDNGKAIVAEAETQDLIAPNLTTIFEVQIDAYYPNVPPLYEGIVTDAKGEEHVFEIAPVAIDDLAGHKSGLIVPSAIGSRVKIIQRTINQNHLRAIDIGYVEQ